MTSHKMFNLGKACLAGTVLTAPAPLLATLVEGRAGLTVLLPVGLAASAIGLLGSHGTDLTDCDDCMDQVTDVLLNAPETAASAAANAAMSASPDYLALAESLEKTAAGRDFADRYAAHRAEYGDDTTSAA